MDASELKYQVESRDGETHFFDRKTMRFFGDSMRNFGVRSAVVRTNYDRDGKWTSSEGVEVEVWELYRKAPVKGGLRTSTYFDKTTFKRVHKSA